MSDDRKKLPGVLLLLLSTLGFLIGLGGALLTLLGVSLVGSGAEFNETLSILSSGLLALLVALLNIPAFILSIRYLQGKSIQVKIPSLFKTASVFLILWVCSLAFGYFTLQQSGSPWIVSFLTVVAVIIPNWWLVEFSRRGIPRSNAAREWGALSVGLTAAPFIIMVIEILLLVLVGVGVFFVLSTQPEALRQISEILRNFEDFQGSLEQLEQLVFDLAQNPAVAGGLFLVIGIMAPFIEEIFKPMAIWFLLNRPLKDLEGFSLGLISGGAFALLESAGLVGQIGADTWLTAVVLRAATGLLHVGLSGLVGYGLVRTCNQKVFARAFLYLLAAGGLHGVWNSLALLSGFATSPMQAQTTGFQPTIENVLPILGMIAVFTTVLVIVLRINRDFRRMQIKNRVDQDNQPNA